MAMQNSNYIFWVGNEIIDGSNKALLSSFNACVEQMTKESDPKTQSSALDKLVSSVFIHFALEEKNMDMQNYPDFQRHQEDHIRYSCQIVGLYKEFKKGHKTVLGMISDLIDELSTHILIYDLDYARYLRSKSLQ